MLLLPPGLGLVLLNTDLLNVMMLEPSGHKLRSRALKSMNLRYSLSLDTFILKGLEGSAIEALEHVAHRGSGFTFSGDTEGQTGWGTEHFGLEVRVPSCSLQKSWTKEPLRLSSRISMILQSYGLPSGDSAVEELM